jgi:hypothetical protein
MTPNLPRPEGIRTLVHLSLHNLFLQIGFICLLALWCPAVWSLVLRQIPAILWVHLRRCLELGDCLCGLVVRVPGYRFRGPWFDSRSYHNFWEVVVLERGLLSLVSTTEELYEWKSSGSGSRKTRLTAVGIRCADQALTSPISGGCSVGIVWLWTKATEFSIF